MAVVARTARIRLTDSLGAFREWTATARVQDTPAGAQVTVDIVVGTGGLAPAAASLLELSIRADANGPNDTDTAIRTISLPVPGNSTTTFHLTDTGLSTGAARAGTFRLRLLAENTTAALSGRYRLNSDDGTTQSVPAGHTVQRDQGWVRGATTATVTASRAQGAAAVPLLAHPDPIWQRIVLGAPLLLARQFTARFGALSGLTGSATQTFDRQHTGVVDTRFAAALAAVTQGLTVPNATLTGQPATVLTATTAPTQDVDPRLTRTPLFQLDDDSFGTPPSVKDDPIHRRLTSQQGFLGSRTTNARGDGVNGVVYDVSLVPMKPGTPVQQTGLTTATRGGQDGWSPTLLSWSSGLPGGRWVKSVTVTSPAGYTQAAGYVVQNGSTDYFLVAVDPDVSADLIVGGTSRDRHLHAGDVLIVGLELQNTLDTDAVLTPDSDATGPIVVALIKRPNADASGSEYLDADLTWQPTVLASGARAAVTRHRLPVVAGTGGQVFRRIFPASVLADTSDIAVTGRMVREGAAYQSKVVREVVGATHAHGTAEAAGGDVQPEDIAAIANAVWDEPTVQARATDSFGQLVLARLDAAVSTRAAAAAVTALGAPAQADALLSVAQQVQQVRADIVGVLSAVGALGSPAQQVAMAEALADLDTVLLRLNAPVADVLALVGTRASQTSVDGLGDPLQTDDTRLAALDAPISSRTAPADLQAAPSAQDVATAVRGALPEINRLDAPITTRATAADVAATPDVYGGSLQ